MQLKLIYIELKASFQEMYKVLECEFYELGLVIITLNDNEEIDVNQLISSF